ncbi:MAG: YjbH domain-containing protein [Thiogranum sp.]
MKRILVLLIWFAALLPGGARSEPNLFGQNGLVTMPDARISPAGDLRVGASISDPYLRTWASIAATSWVELVLWHANLDSDPDSTDPALDDNRYRAADVKLRLLREGKLLPQVAVGRKDLFRNSEFTNNYISLSKHAGIFDFTAGYADSYIKDFYGGARIRPFQHVPLGFLVDYKKLDTSRRRKNSLERLGLSSGTAFGIEFRKNWFGGQLSYQDGDSNLTAYLQIPLDRKRKIEKYRPTPRSELTRKPVVPLKPHGEKQDGKTLATLASQLRDDGFTGVEISISDAMVRVRASHDFISDISRAVGRIARALDHYAPEQAREFEITYTYGDMPVVTYYIKNRHDLTRYFSGLKAQSQMENEVSVTYPAKPLPDAGDTTRPEHGKLKRENGLLYMNWQDEGSHSFTFFPVNADLFMHDTDHPLRFEFYSLAKYRQHLARGLFLDGALRLTLWEDVSKASQPSSSDLPHVRSDVGRYKDNGRLQIDSLLLNQYFHPDTAWYARASGGIYEEMFMGGGGQVLYLPGRQRWAVDFSADWLRQRDTRGALGTDNYSVLTALLGIHYDLPVARLNAGLKAGQFLAEDRGVRFELSRRFLSGIEFGAWYTVTDGDDKNFPGSSSNPYHDRGIFLTVPLDYYLGKENRYRSSWQLRSWERDVGRMVVSPDDLYSSIRRTTASQRDAGNWMTDFGQ